jgi:uncharacterized protein (DUF885 family)
VSDALHPYVEFVFDADPILASGQGDTRGRTRLGDIEPEAFAAQDETRARLLAEAEAAAPAEAGTVERLEQQVLLTEMRTTCHRSETEATWRRAPYWYAERLGAAIGALMSSDGDPDAAEALLARLRAIPGYCAQAQRNLSTDTPQLWAELGLSSARGLEQFLGRAVAGYAQTRPGTLGDEIAAAATAAAQAAADFAVFVAELAGRAAGSWACGREQFDFLLRTYHHLDLDAAGLAELGRELVERERAALQRLAAEIDPGTSWQAQIDRIKDWHPQPPQFLRTYEDAMRRAREHTREHDLITLPEGEVCELDWVPEFRRDGLPLGEMSPSPPFAPGLRSGFLITPGDDGEDAARRREHMRDNCFVFATSIAGHETYPGHHVQYVHHKLGTPRGSIRRYFSTPQFVEGWGLYVEDVLEQTGFMADDRVRLFKQRNALWRALRVVVDVGLHTGTTSLPAATELMQREAGMDPHLAAGEVRRYARHDNPTYPSSYALGRDLIHRLRAEHERARGSAFTLRTFHDWLLSFGSPPVPLLAQLHLG